MRRMLRALRGRDVWTSVVEVAGFVWITAGVSLVHVPSGLIVGGCSLVAVGALAARGES